MRMAWLVYMHVFFWRNPKNRSQLPDGYKATLNKYYVARVGGCSHDDLDLKAQQYVAIGAFFSAGKCVYPV